jgi:hypothetical protein
VRRVAVASSAMQVCKCIDAASGAEMPFDGAHIDLPGRSVVWIDIEILRSDSA